MVDLSVYVETTHHNISYERNDVDVMACAITRLADNDVVSNDATRALAHLRRAKVIDTTEAHKLLLGLLAEMRMVHISGVGSVQRLQKKTAICKPPLAVGK